MNATQRKVVWVTLLLLSGTWAAFWVVAAFAYLETEETRDWTEFLVALSPAAVGFVMALYIRAVGQDDSG